MRQEADGRLRPSHGRHELRADALRLRSPRCRSRIRSDSRSRRAAAHPLPGLRRRQRLRDLEPVPAVLQRALPQRRLRRLGERKLPRAGAADVAGRRGQRAPARLTTPRCAAAAAQPSSDLRSAARSGSISASSAGASSSLGASLLESAAAASSPRLGQQIVEARVVGAREPLARRRSTTSPLARHRQSPRRRPSPPSSCRAFLSWLRGSRILPCTAVLNDIRAAGLAMPGSAIGAPLTASSPAMRSSGWPLCAISASMPTRRSISAAARSISRSVVGSATWSPSASTT